MPWSGLYAYPDDAFQMSFQQLDFNVEAIDFINVSIYRYNHFLHNILSLRMLML